MTTVLSGGGAGGGWGEAVDPLFTVTRNALSGEKAIWSKVLELDSSVCSRAPLSKPSRRTSSPVVAFQIRTVPSQEAVAIDLPSGEYATEVMRLTWPRSERIGRVESAPGFAPASAPGPGFAGETVRSPAAPASVRGGPWMNRARPVPLPASARKRRAAILSFLKNIAFTMPSLRAATLGETTEAAAFPAAKAVAALTVPRTSGSERPPALVPARPAPHPRPPPP